MIGKERIRGKPPAGRTGRRRHGRGASLPASPYSFVRGHHVSRAQRAFDEPDVVFHSLQSLILSSTSTTSPGHKEPVPRRTWCFTARNPLFLRPGAPRPRDPAGLRRTGRGVSLPASPYSFVAGHHVPRAQWVFGNADVVPRSLQALISSSGGTTSTRPSGPSAVRTWCFTPRNPLFFHHRAPHPSGPAGLRQCGRGASLPAKPYSFITGHHVSWTQGAGATPDVVLHRPQTLIPSSTGTTSPGSSGPPASRTWCFTPCNPLFLRPGAPRPRDPAGLRRSGRGASLPAIPYSFVRGHHVSGVQRASGEPDVVLHSLQSLIPSSGGTTSTRSSRPSAVRTWCFTPRNPLFLRPGAPRPRDPRAHRVPTLKTKAEGNSRPRISLPLTVGGNFPLFPTAPSPLGAAPIGKHFRPASSPEVLPIPNQEAHSIRPGLNGLSSPQNRNGNASRSGSAALLFHHNQKGCAR